MGGDGGGETEELGRGEVSGGGFFLVPGVLGEGFRADVGGVELGVAGFEAEIGGGGVAEEAIGVPGDGGAEGGHAGEVRFGAGGLGFGEPVEAPLERADDAVGVSGGQRGFPGEHPFCVEPGKHGDSLASTMAGANG